MPEEGLRKLLSCDPKPCGARLEVGRFTLSLRDAQICPFEPKPCRNGSEYESFLLLVLVAQVTLFVAQGVS